MKKIISLALLISISCLAFPQQTKAADVSVLPCQDFLASSYDVLPTVEPFLWDSKVPFTSETRSSQAWYSRWKAGETPLRLRSGSVLKLDQRWVIHVDDPRIGDRVDSYETPKGVHSSLTSSDPSILELQKDGTWKALRQGTVWVYAVVWVKFIPSTRADEGKVLQFHWELAREVIVSP